jgi:hypothetical protein
MRSAGAGNDSADFQMAAMIEARLGYHGDATIFAKSGPADISVTRASRLSLATLVARARVHRGEQRGGDGSDVHRWKCR